MDFMMSCDGMKPPITSGGGGGGLQWPNKTLMSESRIFNAAGGRIIRHLHLRAKNALPPGEHLSDNTEA